ncbi:sigma-54-dependent Fis family transcriptional regulator [Rhodothermaceae bacterium RA]|nr:sigma-54-dependent Fis family transcriptional regulator [Rhodothermaceae bacterium RA]
MDRESIQERFGIIGTSAALKNVIDRIRQVARTDITVLIQGESGVGKELVAQAIHQISPRRHGPLVIVNCGAIPEGLIESELFGAEKGAYTGATERRSGYFEEADKGTIFLDEIGEMPPSAQVRLLRVLENGQFTRVGSATVLKTDVRVVAATNKDLAREVEAGRFREDLYYRLSTVLIHIPPLRERKEDILPILEQFLHRFAQQYNTPMKRLEPETKALLLNYRWPGNVRELRNVAEQITVLIPGERVTPEAVRPFLRGVTASGGASELMPVARGAAWNDSSEARERELIYRALLELRLEVREMKEQIEKLVAGTALAVPRHVVEHRDAAPETGQYVILRDADRDDYAALIEDVPYEIAGEEPGTNGTRLSAGAPKEEDAEPEIPTLEDAERELITRALRRFDGNRRQTARALGISERTLYRKLKDMDEDL